MCSNAEMLFGCTKGSGLPQFGLPRFAMFSSKTKHAALGGPERWGADDRILHPQLWTRIIRAEGSPISTERNLGHHGKRNSKVV
jgi:hypothetical protein